MSITPFGSPVVPLEYGQHGEVVLGVDLDLRRVGGVAEQVG